MLCYVVPDTGPCLSNPCDNKGICINRDDDFICHCVDGYSGILCDVAPDPCDANNCKHGSTCVSVDTTSYTCDCTDMYTGTYCQHRRGIAACLFVNGIVIVIYWYKNLLGTI